MKYFIFWIIIFSSTITFSQENLKAGDQVPEFKFWLTNGSKLTKNDIQNKVVVFKFWFTSCLSCLEDTSLLNDLVDVYKERKDILFIAPALDRKEIVKAFLKKTVFKFKTAYSAIDASLTFNPKQVYPSYFIIDKTGTFSYIDNGTKKSKFLNLKRAVEKTLLGK